MYNDLLEVYWELVTAKEYMHARYEHLLDELRRVGIEELNLPPVAVDLFLAAEGHHGYAGENQRLAWKYAVKHLCPDGRWLTTEEAKETGAWDQALRAAIWAFHVFRPWLRPGRKRQRCSA